MKTIYSIVAICLLTNPLLAQTNYVVNSASGSSAAPYNTLIGVQAGVHINSSGQANVFTGYQAGYSNTSGTNNVFVGLGTGYNNTTGIQNVALGHQAGVGSGSGNNNNVSIGYQAGVGSGQLLECVNIGYMAGHNSSGYANVFIGTRSGLASTTGTLNVFIGQEAGYSDTNGGSNSFLGSKAGYSNTSGSHNSFLGAYSGFNNTTGNFNLFLGSTAGGGNTTGSSNCFVGLGAGGSNSTGSNNTFLGFNADVGASNLTNATAIGNGATVNISNALVLGNGANVGIGNSAPTVRLHITTGTAGQSGLRLENLTNSTTASVINQTKFLTVDASGNVILGSLNSSGRMATNELWSATGDYVQNANTGGVVIGQGLSTTPAGYKLFVEQGILTEKVKVAVKNTSDWSDYVLAPGYKLAPLAEVETYIQQTGHLPGFPSAEQMVAQGNDLHQTDARLLAKVEELTLYSIQLEKRAKQAEAQNQRQQARFEQQQAQLDELQQVIRQLLKKK